MDTNFIHFAVQQMVPIPGTYIQQLSISDNENIYTILLSFTTIILNLVKYVIGKCKLLSRSGSSLNSTRGKFINLREVLDKGIVNIWWIYPPTTR